MNHGLPRNRIIIQLQTLETNPNIVNVYSRHKDWLKSALELKRDQHWVQNPQEVTVLWQLKDKNGSPGKHFGRVMGFDVVIITPQKPIVRMVIDEGTSGYLGILFSNKIRYGSKPKPYSNHRETNHWLQSNSPFWDASTTMDNSPIFRGKRGTWKSTETSHGTLILRSVRKKTRRKTSILKLQSVKFEDVPHEMFVLMLQHVSSRWLLWCRRTVFGGSCKTFPCRMFQSRL